MLVFFKGIPNILLNSIKIRFHFRDFYWVLLILLLFLQNFLVANKSNNNKKSPNSFRNKVHYANSILKKYVPPILGSSFFLCKRRLNRKNYQIRNKKHKKIKIYGKLLINHPKKRKLNFTADFNRNKSIKIYVYAIFNIKVFEIIISKTHVLLIDKLNKKQQKYNYKEFSMLLGLNIDFKTIQNIFLAENLHMKKYTHNAILDDLIPDFTTHHPIYYHIKNNNIIFSQKGKYDQNNSVKFNLFLKIFIYNLLQEAWILIKYDFKEKNAFYKEMNIKILNLDRSSHIQKFNIHIKKIVLL